jgi:hypothetical protein
MNELFSVFLSSLVSLVVCAVAGFICRKARILDDAFISGLTTLLVKVALPCTIFISMMRPFSRTLLAESGATFFLSTAVYLFGGLLGLTALKIIKYIKRNAPPPEAGGTGEAYANIMVFVLIFANVGYMGFPVIQAVFGEEGMIYASMANASFNILAFSLGVHMFQKHAGRETNGAISSSAKKLLLSNVALISACIGFIFFVTGFRLPQPVNGGIAMIGAMTTPISMLLIGSILAKNPLKTLFDDWKIFPVMAARLLVIPVIAFYILRLFIVNTVMLGVIVVLTAMPAASLTAIFAEKYKSETALASKLVAFSTLLSVLTVPVIALMLGII